MLTQPPNTTLPPLLIEEPVRQDEIREHRIQYFDKGVYIKYVGGGARVLQVFQKIFCSLEDHRAKYFMTQ